jgi:predicted membrane-bound mannosyltransferase
MTDLSYEAENEQSSGYQLTIADGALLLIGAMAAVLRLVNLGGRPLSPAEAEAALAVWQFWHPGQAELSIGSPAYFTLTGLLAQVLGFSDGVMRLVPALFGVGLVLLPWLLRKQLGEAGMLATAVFLAISPITSAIARTAGGDSIALFAALLLLAAWVRLQIGGNGRWRYALLLALALGLTSAPLYSTVLCSP